MLDHDYTKKDIFNDNFFRDWRTVCKKLNVVDFWDQVIFLIVFSTCPRRRDQKYQV